MAQSSLQHKASSPVTSNKAGASTAQLSDHRVQAREHDAHSSMMQNSARATQFKQMQTLMHQHAAAASVIPLQKKSTGARRPDKPVLQMKSGLIAQRKNLTQAGAEAAIGVKETTGVHAIADGAYTHPTAKVYADPEPLEAESKDDAYLKNAVRSGRIGARLIDHAPTIAPIDDPQFAKKHKKKRSNYFYSEKISERNSAAEKGIDPFSHSTYTTLPENKYIVMVCQHTQGFDGYVSKIQEGTKEGDSPAEAVITGTMNTKTEKVSDTEFNYSNLHDTTVANTNTETKSDTLSATANKGGLRSFDAITKLVGEGSRFLWVREQLGTIKDDTPFRIQAEEGVASSPMLSITFKDLWVTWKDWFHGEYNISNDTITAVLREKWRDSRKHPDGIARKKDRITVTPVDVV